MPEDVRLGFGGFPAVIKQTKKGRGFVLNPR